MTRVVALLLCYLVSVAYPMPAEPPAIPTMLAAAEQRHGLPDGLLYAIAEVESRLDPNATGSEGEIGVMQLHPDWHTVPDSTEEQIDVAAAYLARLIDRHGLERGIAAYNQGPANPVVGKYVRRVQAAWEQWRGETGL